MFKYWTVPTIYRMEIETSSLFSRHFQCRMRHQDMRFTRSNFNETKSMRQIVTCKPAFSGTGSYLISRNLETGGGGAKLQVPQAPVHAEYSVH